MRERTGLDNSITGLRAMEAELCDCLELIEMGEAVDDGDIVAEAEVQIEALQVKLDRLRLETMLSGEADGNNCYVEIHAGAGGTEHSGRGTSCCAVQVRPTCSERAGV